MVSEHRLSDESNTGVAKGSDDMSLKGEKTKQDIREKAYQLFAEKGFKAVTMKDICDRTGLSHGGLYRHYVSTEQIFLEIVHKFSDKQKNEVSAKIEQRIPAVTILVKIRMGRADRLWNKYKRISLCQSGSCFSRNDFCISGSTNV